MVVDIKCTHHPQHDIIFICKSCSNHQPVCKKCVTTLHQDHGYLDIEDLDNNIQNEIKSIFFKETLPQLDKILNDCKSTLEESDKHFNQIEADHNNNFNNLETEFKKLKDIINAKETDLKKQLLTLLDENKDTNINNTTLYNNTIATLNNIKNDNSNNNNNTILDQNQFIELLKRNYQIISFGAATNSKNKNALEEYKDTKMFISKNSFNLIKKNINNMVQISNKMIPISNNKKQFLKNENGFFSYLGIDFKVYEDGDDITNYNVTCVAIQNGHHIPPEFPRCVIGLLLPDDFDQPIASLPNQIRYLYFFNIKLQLLSTSFPKNITDLLYFDGFSQKLNSSTISPHIQSIYLADTVHPLELTPQSYPNFNNLIVYKYKTHQHKTPVGMQYRNMPQ